MGQVDHVMKEKRLYGLAIWLDLPRLRSAQVDARPAVGSYSRQYTSFVGKY